MSDDNGLKRAACLIASQLPDNEMDAMRVLDLARGIIEHLNDVGAPAGAEVIRFSPVRISPAAAPTGGQVVRIDFPGKASPV